MNQGMLEAAQAQANVLSTYRPASLTERLRVEKQNLESRLQEINQVLILLEDDPKVQQVLDAVSRLGHL